MEPPEPPATEPELLEEEAELTAITQTADKEELDKQDEKRGRGSHRPPAVGFFQRLKNHTQEEWENLLLLYVYRLAPITDRLATGNQYKYIGKFSEPIDEDTILKNELWGGSGTYRITLNVKDPTNGKSKIEDQVQVEIENRAYPPKVPAGEWMEDPRNKRWAWAREGAAAPAAAVQSPSSVQSVRDTIQAVKEISDFVQAKHADPGQITGNNLVELLKTTLTAQPNMLETIQGVIQIAKPAEVKPDNTVVTLLTAMLENQRIAAENQRKEADDARRRADEDAKAARQQEREMLKDMLTEARKQPDTLAQFSKFGEVFKTLKEEIAPADSAESKQSRMNGWQEFFAAPLTELMSGIKPLLAAGAQILIMKNAQAQQQRPGQPQPQTQQQQPGPPQRFTSPAAEVAAPQAQPATQQQAPPMQPPEPPQAPPATAPQPEGMPPMPPMNLESQYQQQLISRVLEAYLDKLRDRLSDPDETGDLLAAFMCDDTISLGNLPPFRLKGYEAFTGLKKAGADVGMTPREFILMQFRETRDQTGRQFLWEEFAGTPAKEKRFIEYIDAFLEYDPDQS